MLNYFFEKWRPTVLHEIKEVFLSFDIFGDEEVGDDSCLP